MYIQLDNWQIFCQIVLRSTEQLFIAIDDVFLTFILNNSKSFLFIHDNPLIGRADENSASACLSKLGKTSVNTRLWKYEFYELRYL